MAASRNQYYSGFDPRQLSNCQLWLDAADQSTITFSSGSNVTIWKDKSGNAYDASAVGVPVWANGPTGLRGMVFDGTDKFTGTAANTTGTLAAFVVFDMSSATQNNGRVLSFAIPNQGDFGSNGWISAIQRTESTQQVRIFRNFQSLSPRNISYNVPFIATVDVSTPFHTLTSNGSLGTTSSFSGGSFSYTRYGVADYPDYVGISRLVGTVYEVIVYNQAFSTNQIRQVEGYLAWKWGLNASLLGGFSNHPYRYVSAVTRPLGPPDLGSNLALWLDAADATTVALSGANVTTWFDKSGNRRHLTQGTSGNRPLYYTYYTGAGPFSAISNDVFVSFSRAGSQFLDVSDGAGLAVGRRFSTFIVESRTSSDTVNYWFGGTGSTTNSNLHTGYRSDSQATLAFFGNDLNATIPTYATNSNIRVWGLEYNQANQIIYINGTNSASRANTTNLAAWAGAAMGRYQTSYYSGRMREVVWCTPSLTTFQRQQMEGYLAWKWNRQGDLPVAHPFKTYYPLVTSFVPPTLSAFCQVWLDAAQYASFTFSSGSNISIWDDRALGRDLSQGSAATAPILSNTSGNLPVVANTGTSGLRGGSFDPNGLSNITIFVVCNTTSATEVSVNTGRLILWFPETGSWGQIQLYVSQTRLDWRFGTGQANNTPTFNLPSNVSTSYNIISVTKASTAETGFLNGTNIASYTAASNTIANTSNVFVITGPSISSTYSANNIAEMIIYTGNAVTTTDRQLVEGYLAWKWGLVDKLPIGHPYKTLRP